ncbi:MAG: glycosyltransferase family 2 protein [Bacteroidales bacterium]|nr:glycosyltransferase family 2 protein [Bacteroidales bacterium]
MKISVITVTYNAEATICRTMESVARQTYPSIEHVVIDGASKDRTVAIAREYPAAVIVSEPDRGLYDAMNKGLKLATGDFVCFLNAGDKLHDEDTIARVVQAILAVGDAAAVGLVYGDTHIVDDDGRFLRPRHLTPPDVLTWRSFRSGMLVCHQSFYINRSIALPYDLSYRFSADFDWCIRCMQEGERRGMMNVYVREPLTDYLHEGMTTANHRASLQERFSIMAKHYGLVPTVLYHIGFVFRIIKNKVKRF